MKYGFAIDNRKCIGCHGCTVACKSEHQVAIGVNRTWVKYTEKGKHPDTRRHFSVHRCNHCSNAPCVEICPVTALYKRDDGIVDFNKDRCIGCRSCMQACPYDSLYIDPDTKTSAKCNFCAHRLDKGLEPACVSVCPEQAIVCGDLDDPSSEVSKLLSRQTAQVRKPEKNTDPKLFYIGADMTAIDSACTPCNEEYLWSAQAAGVGHHAGDAADPSPTRSPEKKSKLFGMSMEALTGKDKGQREPKTDLADTYRRVYDVPSKGVQWGWEVSAYLWTKSISAGVILIPLFLTLFGIYQVPTEAFIASAVVSVIFLAATGALLIKDIDRPERFLYVMLRPQMNSWLVKGGASISIFGGAVTALAALLFLEIPLTGNFIGIVVSAAVLISGLSVSIYTGFLLAQAKGRDFWQNPLIPFNMLLQALMSGGATLMLILFVMNNGIPPVLVNFVMGATGLHLLMLFIEVNYPHASHEAETVMHMIVRGSYQLLFLGAVILGHIVPMLCFGMGSPMAVSIGAMLIILGVLLLEHVWVRAPQTVTLS